MFARPWTVIAAALTGATLGLGVGLPLAFGDPSVLVVGMVGIAMLAAVIRIVPRNERRRVAAIAGVAIGIRLAAAAILHFGSLAAGQGGFITGDDAAYARLASGYLAWLRGDQVEPYLPPLWGGNAYLFGTFVYLETALFLVFGPTTLAMTCVNALLSALVVTLAYDITRRFAGPAPATFTAIAVSLYPSLVLWSSLNLKDTLVITLVVCALWSLQRMQERPQWLFLGVTALALLALESLRRYVFLGLAALAPLAVSFSASRRRIAWTAVTLATSIMLVAAVAVTGGLGGSGGALAVGFADLERIRAAMAAGARTAFADPLGATGGNDALVLTRTLSYVPRGVAYTLFAPFPWDVHGLRDLVTLPEMLLWYLSLIAAPIGVYRAKRWRATAPLVLYVVGLLGLFVLVEGNVGTLFRHRAMVVPFVIMLAAPVLVEAATALQRRKQLT